MSWKRGAGGGVQTELEHVMILLYTLQTTRKPLHKPPIAIYTYILQYKYDWLLLQYFYTVCILYFFLTSLSFGILFGCVLILFPCACAYLLNIKVYSFLFVYFLH